MAIRPTLESSLTPGRRRIYNSEFMNCGIFAVTIQLPSPGKTPCKKLVSCV